MSNFDCEKVSHLCNYRCCSLHIFEKDLWIHKRDYASEVTEVFELPQHFVVMTLTMRCPFWSRENHRCRIYNYRPNICRICGTKNLPCAWQKPSGLLRTPKETEEILQKYNEQNKIVRDKILCK